MKLIWMLLCLLGLLAIGEAANQQAEAFRNFLKSRLFRKPSSADSLAWFQNKTGISPNYIQPQDGSMDADKVGALPGQPKDIGFNQYAGYVTVDSQGGRALFYYFVESPVNSSKNPLVLWLNGGPGCSSLIGAFSEVGPFRINSDGKTLYQNNYTWNNVANVIFLDSPVGIGYSYSNTTTDYLHLGDKSTAADAYTFLVNWLERFPQYKTRDFYIIGENYAGHFAPQLAYTILVNNKNSNNQTLINLKGIAVGNGWIDDHSTYIGSYDYLWSHGFNSDETNKAIHTHCPFDDRRSISPECFKVMVQAQKEIGPLNDYNIYAPDCPLFQPGSPSLENYTFDPCTDTYMIEYLSRAEVQTALHAKLIHLWDPCSLTRDYRWTDTPVTVLPIIQNLTVSGLRVWLYSGDLDALIPVTATRYGINLLKLSVKTAWRPWLVNHEVGGHVVEYEGLTWVIVRGAGQAVPSYQPERALTMISSFLQGTLPPP